MEGFAACFGELEDPRTGNAGRHDLREILVIALCTLLCGGETAVDMAGFGEAKEGFPRGFRKLEHGIPRHDTFSRVFRFLNPDQFRAGFMTFMARFAEAAQGVIATDGKTLRHSFDTASGQSARHMVRAWGGEQRLVLGQLATEAKSNEITAIPERLDHLAESGQLKGALVAIDAMGCQVEIAGRIVAHGADFLLALKGNPSTLEAGVADCFRTAPQEELVTRTTVEKGHGRIETRLYSASATVDWIESDRSYPGQPKFNHIKSIVRVVNRTEFKDQCTQDDLSRYRSGFGAKNMAVVHRFALGLVRADKTRGSVKTRRKSAGWDTDYLLHLLQIT